MVSFTFQFDLWLLNSYDFVYKKKQVQVFSRVDSSKSKIISSLYGQYTNLEFSKQMPEESTVLYLQINIKLNNKINHMRSDIY